VSFARKAQRALLRDIARNGRKDRKKGEPKLPLSTAMHAARQAAGIALAMRKAKGGKRG
jgi:hypothetical protein